MSDQQTLEYLMAEVSRLREREAQLEAAYQAAQATLFEYSKTYRAAEARVAQLENFLEACGEILERSRYPLKEIAERVSALAHEEEK